MTQNQLSILENAGVDSNAAINRFCGNMDMYQKFLFKFLDDKSYENLMSAIKVKDFDTAILHVHSLKGVSGNLGLNKIFDLSSTILNSFKKGNFEDPYEDIKKLTAEYNNVVKAIEFVKKGV